jgi:WD40 repeat protein
MYRLQLLGGKVVCIWDTVTGERRQRWKAHEMVVSGSDDGYVKILDDRKWCEAQTSENKHQVTTVSYSGVGDMVQSGGCDNGVKVKLIGGA